jgi:hypothetical protein
MRPKVTVRTDSNAVEWVLGETSKGRMLKWVLSLQELQFKIVNHPGTKQGNADPMSRCPLDKWSSCPYGGGCQEPLYGVAPPYVVASGAITRSKRTKVQVEVASTQQQMSHKNRPRDLDHDDRTPEEDPEEEEDITLFQSVRPPA